MRRRRLTAAIFALLLTLGLVACDGATDLDDPIEDDPLEDDSLEGGGDF